MSPSGETAVPVPKLSDATGADSDPVGVVIKQSLAWDVRERAIDECERVDAQVLAQFVGPAGVRAAQRLDQEGNRDPERYEEDECVQKETAHQATGRAHAAQV